MASRTANSGHSTGLFHARRAASRPATSMRWYLSPLWPTSLGLRFFSQAWASA